MVVIPSTVFIGRKLPTRTAMVYFQSCHRVQKVLEETRDAEAVVFRREKQSETDLRRDKT